MAQYVCEVCGHVYDEEKEGIKWEDLPDSWTCPVCESPKSYYVRVEERQAVSPGGGPATSTETISADTFVRQSDELETYMADIHAMAETGESIIEPMRTKAPAFSWDDILIKGAQLAKLPLNKDKPVNTQTVIGVNAAKPLVIESPLYVTHMSYGALSKEVKIALAKGSAEMKTAMCSGEGGILPESFEQAYKYIFEYVPNKYSVTEENLKRVDAIEIKIGQSAKPGMGGHLPAKKVSKEIAEIRGFPEGTDIISPAHFPDITTQDELKQAVTWLRDVSEGRPIGVKFAAGNIEADLEVALFAEPDFITIDGRAGSTGAAPKFVKMATSMPTMFALQRAKKFLQKRGVDHVALIITGGLRISPDFAKALALGADAIALGTSALMACGCQQYRICHTGKCPMGITTQDPKLRARFDIETSSKRLANFLRVSTKELQEFARLTGNADLRDLSINDLCTTNSEISTYTGIEHV